VSGLYGPEFKAERMDLKVIWNCSYYLHNDDFTFLNSQAHENPTLMEADGCQN
jgi:hypothetical protein